jgi:hypothetical protein
MPEEQKETYPVIPAKHWWMLRKRFQQSMSLIGLHYAGHDRDVYTGYSRPI